MNKYLLFLIMLCGMFCMSCSKDDSSDENDNYKIVDLTGVEETEDGYFDGTLYYKITSDSISGQVADVVKCVDTAVSVEIPGGVKIKDEVYKVTFISNAFYFCDKLTSVKIPNTVKTIGCYAFCGCDALTSVKIPNSVNGINDYAFSGCDNLSSVEFGNSVTYISSCAFAFCTALTSITFPNTVKYIAFKAFWGCEGLTSVTIGESATVIGEMAFAGCFALKSITCLAKVPPIIRNATFGFNHDGCTLHVKSGCKAAYEEDVFWNEFTNIVEDA